MTSGSDPSRPRIFQAAVESGQPRTETEGRYRRIALEVLAQAVRDARGTVLGVRVRDRHGRDTAKRAKAAVVREARTWLTNANECLREMCVMAGVEMNALIDKSRREFGEGYATDDYREGEGDGAGDTPGARTIGNAGTAQAEDVRERERKHVGDCACGLRSYFLDRYGRAVLREV